MSHRAVFLHSLDRDEFVSAAAQLRQYILHQPHDLYAHRELVRCSQVLHELPELEQWYEENYRAPNSSEVRLFLRAERRSSDRSWHTAIEDYRAALSLGLDAPEVRHGLALALHGAGRHQDERQELETLLRDNPKYLPALDYYAPWLFSEGSFDRLLEVLDGALGGPPAPPEFVGAAGIQHSLRRFATAVREIENIIRLLRSGQQREAALRCWPLLREYSDNCVLIRTLLGSLRGDPWFGAAKERVKEVVRGSHERYAAGLVSLYEDRPADAVHELDEALGGGLRNASVLCARARAEADATGKSNGYDYARQAYDQQPYLAYARASLAMRAKERGDYTLVLSLATMAPEDRVRAVRFEPFGDSYLADLDAQSLDVLLRQGAVSTALLEVRSRPAVTDDAALLFRRAMVYVASSDFDSADRELAAALSADENVVARAAGEDRRRCVDLSAQRPSSRAATLACVLQEIHAGDPQHALAGLQSLAGYWPEDARILLHLGRVLELLGDVEAAANYYGLLIDRSPIVKRARDALLQSCVAASPPRDVLVALRQLAFGGYNAALLMAADCDKRLARDLAVEILEVDAQNYLALSHLGSVLDPESGEFLPVLKRLADIHPFDFELRRIAARHQLERGVVGDSADRFATLVRDGSCDLRDVLLYGIASLAAAVTAK